LSECHNCGKSLDDNYAGIGHRYCSERCQYYCEDFHYTCFREGTCLICPTDTRLTCDDNHHDYDSLVIPHLEDSRERDEQSILFIAELQKYKNTLDDFVSSPLTVGSCALTVGSCALTVGSCALTVGSCALTTGSCALTTGSCALTTGSCALTTGSCALTTGSCAFTAAEGGCPICTEGAFGADSNICSDCWATCSFVPPSRGQHNDALYGSTKFDDPPLHRGVATPCAICAGDFHIADMATIDDDHLVCTDCFYDEENNWLTCANCGAFSGANMFCVRCNPSFASRCFRCTGDDAKPSDFYYKLDDTDTPSLLACVHCYQSLQCMDCHTFTDYRLREQLCFDCHFKKPLRPQKSLDDHLLTIGAIQRLSPKHFDVLVRYAALCEFTIFDAYHYKSRCHWSGCYKDIPPVAWNPHKLNQFCSHRHYELFDEYNPHGHYDTIYEEYECLTCKACKSPHQRNLLLMGKCSDNLILDVV